MNEKTVLSSVDFLLATHCNLSCKGCVTYSSISKTEFRTIEEHEKDLIQLKKKFDSIPYLKFLGGEPLMNPDVASFFEMTRKYYPDSMLQIWTNGLWLGRMKRPFWERVNKDGIHIVVTLYPGTKNKKGEIENLLLENSANFLIRESEDFRYMIKEEKTDKYQNFKNCLSKKCHNIYEGKIYHCCTESQIGKLNDKFGTSYPDTGISIYDSKYSGDEILKYLEDTPSDLCSFCHKEAISFPHENLPKTDLFDWVQKSRKITIFYAICSYSYEHLILSVETMVDYHFVGHIVILHTDPIKPKYLGDLERRNKKVSEYWKDFGSGYLKKIEDGGYDEVASRNYIISIAETKGDYWILQCDGDEIYLKGIEELLSVEEDGIFFNIYNLCDDSSYIYYEAHERIHEGKKIYDWHMRMWKNGEKIRFERNPYLPVGNDGVNMNESIHCIPKIEFSKCHVSEEVIHIHLKNCLTGFIGDSDGRRNLPKRIEIPERLKGVIKHRENASPIFIKKENILTTQTKTRSLVTQSKRRDNPVKSVSVGSFYYDWYGDGWEKRADRIKRYGESLFKPYDSKDEAIVAKHINQAKEGAIDFFILSYNGHYSRENFERMKKVSPKDFQYCIHYETVNIFGPGLELKGENYEKAVNDFRYFAATFLAEENYFKIDGKPVMYIYATRDIEDLKPITDLKAMVKKEFGINLYIVGDEMWWKDRDWIGSEERLNVFDAVFPYNLYTSIGEQGNQGYFGNNYIAYVEQVYEEFYGKCIKNSVGVQPTIMPRYNDSGYRDVEGHYLLPPDDGGFLKSYYQMAKKYFAGENIVLLITSFNEWYEDTQIEPYVTDQAGDDYDPQPSYGNLYLDIVKEIKEDLKGEIK